MRAPPESLMPIIGEPVRIAKSITLQIFSANASPSEPPSTEKSCENRKTWRPSMVARPVMTPSPKNSFSSRPNAFARWMTNRSNSTKESSSTSASTRSRAERLPRACCRASASGPAGIADSARLASSSSYFSARLFTLPPLHESFPLSSYVILTSSYVILSLSKDEARGARHSLQNNGPMLRFCCCILALVVTGAIPAGFPTPPPIPPQRAVAESKYGTSVTDPYRYFENMQDPVVVQFFKEQNDYTRAVLGRLGEPRERLFDRIKELDNAGVLVTGVTRDGPYYFYEKLNPGDSGPKLYVRSVDGSGERVLVDPQSLATAGKHYTINYFLPSLDGRR